MSDCLTHRVLSLEGSQGGLEVSTQPRETSYQMFGLPLADFSVHWPWVISNVSPSSKSWFSDNVTQWAPLLSPTWENSWLSCNWEGTSWHLKAMTLNLTCWERGACPGEIQSCQQHQVLRCSGFPSFLTQAFHTPEGEKNIAYLQAKHGIKMFLNKG